MSVSHANWFWGWCPSTKPISSLDASKFAGDWFELAAVRDIPFLTHGLNARYYITETASERWNYTRLVTKAQESFETSMTVGCFEGSGNCALL
jgi:hypothetical protein